jgi:hypothetical protein
MVAIIQGNGVKYFKMIPKYMKISIAFMLLVGIFYFSIQLTLAETQTLGTFQQNSNINLIQQCTNSTYANITRVILPNSTFALNGQFAMTKLGDDYSYTLSLGNTSLLGEYLVYGICNEDGSKIGWQYNFYITTTGDKVSLSNIILVIAFLVIAGILFILGFTFEKDKFVLKTSFYLFSLIMCLIALNSGRIIASESSGLSSMSNGALILLISVIAFILLYIFIYWTIKTFNLFKQKKEERWKY